jgi:hypothetical protein
MAAIAGAAVLIAGGGLAEAAANPEPAESRTTPGGAEVDTAPLCPDTAEVGDHFTVHDSEMGRNHRIEIYLIGDQAGSLWEERVLDRGSFGGSYHFAVNNSNCEISDVEFAPPESGRTTVTPGGVEVDTAQLCQPALTDPQAVLFTARDEGEFDHEFRVSDHRTFYEFRESVPAKATKGDYVFDVDKESCSLYRKVASADSAPRGRRSDTKPYRAGARIQSREGWCTSGFPIRRKSDGRTFILTAGHCPGDTWWTEGEVGNSNLKVGDTWERNDLLDVQYIRAVDVEGRVYDGGVAPGGQPSKPVAGRNLTRLGDSICVSGASSGVHCGLTVVGHPSPGGRPLGNYWMAYSDGVAVCFGDSGGPVFSRASDPDKVIARGVISRLSWALGYYEDLFDWTNDAGEKLRCGHWVTFADINVALDDFGAEIVTG